MISTPLTRRFVIQSLSALAATRFATAADAPPHWSLIGPFFDDLERRTFQYFWDTAEPKTGLVPDRWPRESLISVAAVGFALTAYPIGFARGWVTREEAAARTRTTLKWFKDSRQGAGPRGNTGYKGFYYHWLDASTGLRHEDSELSTVDTAIFLLGALYCRECFDGTNAVETEIRALADELYARCDWEWARNGGKGIPYAWHPEHGHDPVNWSGYDEGMFIYVLAMGSPTHAIPGSCWTEWTSTYETKFGGFGGKYGPKHLQCAPLFGHQYTQCWMDLRGMKDAYMRKHGIDYFENTRRAALAQQAYAIANPLGWKDYGRDMWGFTAGDGPANVKREFNGRTREFYGYRGRGLDKFDDGTLSPAAVAACLPFAPEIVVPTLNEMHRRYGDLIFTKYGFVDGFNPSFDFADVKLEFGKHVPGKGWFDTDHVAIDQGPILAMFANYRDEGVWARMRKTEWLRKGLRTAGFRGGWIT
jgi:hypothetical protein